MGVKLDLIKPDGRIINLEVGEGRLEKDRFDTIVSIIKDLEGRDYDATAKRWNAPLTEDNVKRLELILDEEEIEELEAELEEAEGKN